MTGAPLPPERPRVLVARAIAPAALSRLREHAEVEANEDDAIWSPAELARRLGDKHGVLVTPEERVDASTLHAAPGLRVVANMAVGFNNLDLAACTARGVVATNTPDVLTETTADFGMALLLAAARRLTEAERYLRDGRWQRWRHDLLTGVDVHGRTLGVLGMGRIGQAVARRAALGFGMRVLYHNRQRVPAETESELGARWVDKDTLLASSDHLLLMLPYRPEHHHAIGAPELARMKPTATLTNLARGGIVDDAALAAALRAGRLHAAALDVFEGEPAVHPALLALDNVVLTPHIASASVATRRAMAELAVDNLLAVLQQRRPPNPLNPELLGPDPA